MKVAARKVARELSRGLDGGSSTDWPQVAKRCLLLLALPKRKVRPRDPRKAERRTTVKELDALCRAVVFARDGGKCKRCGRPAVDWSHVWTRAIRAIRWDPDNSFAACKGCHLWWHRNPVDGAIWWQDQIPHDRYAGVRHRAARPQKTDLSLVRLHLLQEAQRLGVEVKP